MASERSEQVIGGDNTVQDVDDRKIVDNTTKNAVDGQEYDGFRPKIKKYKQGAKFRVDQEVYYQAPGTNYLEGPLCISKVEGNGQYKLSNLDGTGWNGGNSVDQSTLSPTS